MLKTIGLVVIKGFGHGGSTRNPVPGTGDRQFAHVRRGEWDQAIQDYSQAIRLDSGLTSAVISRGDAYLNRGQYDLAIQDYDHAVQLDPTNEQVLRNRHQARLEKVKQDSARTISIEATAPK